MATNKSADEQSKAEVADSVVTNKRQYFVPAHDTSVEALSADEAVKLAKAKTSRKSKNVDEPEEAEEEGDAR